MNTDEWSGQVILIMAPSGSGKSQLITYIQNKFPEVIYALTHTTRKPRPQECSEKTYCFLSVEEFNKKVENDEFLEWAEYSGNKYGTEKTEIFSALMEGKIILKEMDLQGVMQMRKIIPTKFLTVVYIDAGSWKSLKKRILGRAAIARVELELRYERYKKEIEAKPYADIVIKNHNGLMKQAKKDLFKVVESITQTLNI